MTFEGLAFARAWGVGVRRRSGGMRRGRRPTQNNWSGSVALRGFLIVGAIVAALGACRPEEKTAPAATPAAPPSVVTLSPEAARIAGIETAVVGEASLARVLTLTGTLSAKP